MLGLALRALGCGTVALADGPPRPRPGDHTTALAVDLANAVAPQVDALRALRKLAPFYCYLRGDPLRTGLDLGHLPCWATSPRALLAVGVWSLNRLDIAV
jgi:hypothetical protein